MTDLSIIVPVYNVEEYLEECLASVRYSLPSEFQSEVICVNDGSFDGSAEIIAKYVDVDARFSVLSKENGGYGSAINTGMRAAKGRFVTIVESDDVVLPGVYGRLISLLEANGLIDFVKTPYQPFTASGKQEQLSIPPHKRGAADVLKSVYQGAKSSSFKEDRLIFEPPAIWAGLYRKASLERFSITLPEIPGAAYQDTCFSLLCFLNGLNYEWVSDRYYMYRVDRESASRHVKNRRDEMIILFDFIRQNLERNQNFHNVAQSYFYAVYFRRLIWFMQRVRIDYQFDLFLQAYRSFDAVWADVKLFQSVFDLLSKHDRILFPKFRDGQYRFLYAS